ncbi:FxSxx-COOH system tetratricopeptide repeat protein [Actinosynnema sp. NPDC020468]|uniref:FxSxx-COOH system tetratricopeptide repeat protein n=1 Tax=Actinosynnema sp. NPDC020468 TaxID=3154488 RepID=UPI0033CF2B77
MAFLSAVGGAGRTSALVNLAWTLAAAGRRVLVVDWGSESPRVPEYLEPFHAGRVVLPPEAGRLLTAVYSAPGLKPSFTVDRYDVPGPTHGHIDVYAPGSAGGDVPLEAGSGALRAELSALDYDHVLIDAPTGGTDTGLTLIADTADTAVVCFQARSRAIPRAAGLARELKSRVRVKLDVVPVALWVGGNRETERDPFVEIDRHFADFTAPGAHPVRIPFRSDAAHGPRVAVLAEDDDGPDGSVAQYGRLASAVTAGEVDAVPAPHPRTRRLYRAHIGVEAGPGDQAIHVVYAPADRVWADWGRDVLDRAGATTVPARADRLPDGAEPAEVLLVSSAELAAVANGNLPRSAGVVRLVVEAGGPEPPRSGTAVLVPGAREEVVAARLRKHFGLFASDLDVVELRRFPGRAPDVLALPSRHERLVGRDDDLEALRAEVLLRPGAFVVGGSAGIGKSALALEYAYRFAGDYDLVWWIPAHDAGAEAIALTRLEEGMRQAVAKNRRTRQQAPASGMTSALDALEKGFSFPRWLLVYDNADVAEILAKAEALGGPGTVLITADTAQPDLGLDALAPADAKALLTASVPGILSDEDATEVAEAVGRTPLGLQLAAAYLVESVDADRRSGGTGPKAVSGPVRTFLDRFEEQRDQDGEVAERVFAVLLDALRDDVAGPVAVLLAELCTFLSPEGVGLELVRSRAMIDALVELDDLHAATLALDSGEIDRVLWTGVRWGLFQVDWGRNDSLRLHRVVRRALRGAMPADEARRRQARVLEVLAGFAPTEVDEVDGERAKHRVGRFRELQKHVFASDAPASDNPRVRRWLVNQLRFLFTDGGVGVDLGTTDLAHELLASWRDRFGPRDPLAARLGAQLANLERRHGRPQVSYELDQDALLYQRRTLGRGHPQTLISTRGLGGDLRGLGQYAEAVQEDETTWKGFLQALGPDHPHSRFAANNLANSLFLSGDTRAALQIEQDNLDRRRRLFGPESRHSLRSQVKHGVYLRDLGHLHEAEQQLRESRDRLRDPAVQGSELEVLGAQWQLAITERLLAGRERNPLRARRARDRNGAAWPEMHRQHNWQFHPDTQGCRLSFAIDHRVLREPGKAVALARDVLAEFRGRPEYDDDHPFVALTRLTLGTCLHAAGEHEEAVGEIDFAHERLRTRLGPAHPWTLVARNASIRCAAEDHPVEAARLLEELHADCAEYLGEQHPVTDGVAANLDVVRTSGADGDWRDLDVDIPTT